MQHSDKKHIILKYPTRHRPIKFMNNLDAYLAKTSGKHRITVIVTMDIDDSSMNNNPLRYYMTNKIKGEIDVTFSYGNSEGKIAAINRGVPTTDWDIIISTADDMEPVEQGWDDIIVQDMLREFPNLDGALNYNNDPRLEAKGAEGYKTLITLPVIGRKLYDRFGYIYHPAYKSEWCDNEQTEVFEKLGVLRHINSRPIIHKWAENQDALMQRNMQIGISVDRDTYTKRKGLGFDGVIVPSDSKSNGIVQIVRTRDELYLIKEMLPIWQKYADAFIFMDDCSIDGTYEFLTENAAKFNILKVMRVDRVEGEELPIESEYRQQLYDEALKYSHKIICLDCDEYLDGTMNKQQLNEMLDANPDTLFYSLWIQYTGKNEVRIDGKWASHPVDRVGSYANRAIFKTRQMHAEHLPMPAKYTNINYPHLFVAHLQWLDKKFVATKQYYYKIEDYVNRLKFNADVVAAVEYDKSVDWSNWRCVSVEFPLKIRANIYGDRDITQTHKYKFMREQIKKHNIPNLNDWGMGIHNQFVD
jgi:hypothetical protein